MKKTIKKIIFGVLLCSLSFAGGLAAKEAAKEANIYPTQAEIQEILSFSFNE